MTRYLALIVALSACAPQSDRADAALPAIDTLKPVTATDTLAPPPDTARTVRPAPTRTRLGRDSAFPPPRGLPKLDTVPTRRPPGE